MKQGGRFRRNGVAISRETGWPKPVKSAPRKTCCLEIARSSPAAVGPNRSEDLLPGEDLLTGRQKGPSAGIDPIIDLGSAAAQTTNDPVDLLSSA